MLSSIKPSRVVAFVLATAITAAMAYVVLYGATNFVSIMARGWKRAQVPEVTEIFVVPPAN